MSLTRKEFLRITGVTTSGLVLAKLGLLDFLGPSQAYAAQTAKVKYGKDTTSICPYCGVGCGVIVTSLGNKVINIEGNPDHPVNEGALCSKSSSLYQTANNELRMRDVLYRAGGADKWEKVDWNWAIGRVAEKIKDTRDKNFIEEDAKGNLVNRLEALGVIGGSALDNEEAYLATKLSRALGVVHLETQARICHSTTVAGLAPSFGRGAMTNHWVDIKNSDCIMVIGSNAAENHPMSFKWITKAREHGATLIHVDPRFNRTSARADIYARIRPGADIAFIGGLINHVFENELYHKEYVAEYTNASFLIDPKFGLKDGLFSGYNPEKKSYDKATWQYQSDEKGIPRRDKTLKDPDCVFQLLKKNYARYDIDTVCAVCGTSKDAFLKVAGAFCATGKPDKAGTILYAMGTTQHTTGTQYIRAYSILQLLLGNIGIAGGGINAMRGESNVQGATDHAFLFHLLPGYLKAPDADWKDLAVFLDKTTPKTTDPDSVNYWKNTPKFMVSLLKAWWGENAVRENDFCYNHLPKKGSNHSYFSLFDNMLMEKVKGLVILGMNPVVSAANSNKVKKALDKLDWMVAVDLWETDTAVFWKRPGINPKDVKTEVFFFPAAASFEKEGSITNSGRMMQWRYAAVPPLGNAKPDLDILDLLFKAVKKLYSGSTAKRDNPILQLTWNYGEKVDPNAIAKEINGYDLKTGKLLANFTKLADDGSTSCGNWIYSGSYTEEGNMTARRDLSDPSGLGLFPQWAWCWPINRRVVYNRASCDTHGNPYNPARALVKWDAGKNTWINYDVPDFVWKKPTGEIVPPEVSAKSPFLMRVEGVGCLFSKELAEGPFPEHYEPYESPFGNLLARQEVNPCAKVWEGEFDKLGDPGQFPVIATTFRLTEHWQAGAMTRNIPWLAELMPEMFVEMSPGLAGTKGIKDGDAVKIISARGEVSAKACVTERIKPVEFKGRKVEMVAFPWHFGYNGYITGGADKNKDYAANQVTHATGDPNTWMPETKVLLCDIIKEA